MLDVSPGFLAALASPQQVTVRADVSKGGVRLFSGLPVVGGSVTVDASSITRRTLTLDLAPRLSTGTYTDVPTLPSSPGDPLGHYGQEITVEAGMTYTGGLTEWVPLGVFRVDEVRGSLLGDGIVTVAGVSREAFIADARFTAPRTVSSPSAQSLIGTLIHEVLPGVEVVASASMDRRVPPTTFDEDRWGAIQTLAQSIAALVYADPWGRLVIADAPTLDTPPVWTVAGRREAMVPGAPTVVRINRCPNPRLGVNATGWTAGGSAVTRVAQGVGWAAQVGYGFTYLTSPAALAVAGEFFSARCVVMGPSGRTGRVQAHDGIGYVSGSVPVTFTGAPQEVVLTCSAPTAFVAPRVFLYPSAGGQAGDVFTMTDVLLERVPAVGILAGSYFDGATPDILADVIYAWMGGAHASMSTLTESRSSVMGEVGGVLVSAATSSSRARIYNGVVVRGESATSDAAPVSASAYDLDSSSPTRWGDPAAGAFGMVPYFMSLPTITTVGQALAVARANLARHLGAASSVDLSTVPNPALEAGDVIDIIAGGTARRHVVDRFTVPLAAGGAFPVATRDLREADV